MTYKICISCLENKNISEFELRADTKKHRNQCKKCRAMYCAKWYQDVGDVIKNKNQQYKKINKDKLREDNRIYYNNRYQNDAKYRIHKILSVIIRKTLKSKGFSKNRNSISQYLQYSFEQLREHLEDQFEPWMTWENHGKYDPKIWDDNDSSTWTWQIDHIIPRSIFNYTSMDDENFQKCWALNNLRPLSAKQNLMDGLTKIRHI